MKLFSLPPPSRIRASAERWSTCWANRYPSRTFFAFPPDRAQVGGAGHAWRFISLQEPRTPMCESGCCDDKTLGLVDFEMFSHLDHSELPEHTIAHAEGWAASLTVPGYAMDDESAIKVTEGAVAVVSEGHWKLLNS